MNMKNKMLTTLGKKLAKIREQAIKNGMKLLTEDEVLDLVHKRRLGEDTSYLGDRAYKNKQEE